MVDTTTYMPVMSVTLNSQTVENYLINSVTGQTYAWNDGCVQGNDLATDPLLTSCADSSTDCTVALSVLPSDTTITDESLCGFLMSGSDNLANI